MGSQSQTRLSDWTDWLTFLLWFITGCWIEFPVRYSRTLFIHSIYNILQLLIPNSQCIPPPPPPWQPQVCPPCLWVCFCFIDQFISVMFETLHVSDVICDLSLSLWLRVSVFQLSLYIGRLSDGIFRLSLLPPLLVTKCTHFQLFIWLLKLEVTYDPDYNSRAGNGVCRGVFLLLPRTYGLLRAFYGQILGCSEAL